METILFDLDGTILDTNELIIQSFMHALLDQTAAPVVREEIIPHMGKTLLDQMRTLANREDVDDLIVAYRAFNLSKHDELVGEFPHVGEVLSELEAAGITMGVVTTKMRKTAEMGLKLCGLSKYMKTIVTLEDVTHPKPHPEPVEKALKALNADPDKTLMVGDSPADILAANRAGVTSVGVAWSLKGEAGLLPSEPKHIIHDMRELLQIAGIKRGSQ
jgi:pyrophosphatase PpaX